MVGALGSRRLTSSGAFDGIGAANLAEGIIEQAARRHQVNSASGDTNAAVTFASAWAIEWDSKAQDELLLLPEGLRPSHLFGDIGGFVPEPLQEAFQSATDAADMRQLSTSIPCCKPVLEGFCRIHGQRCRLHATDIHVAGSPCIAHSSFGLQKGMEDRRAKYFLIWCALMRTLGMPVIIHENVERFGVAPLETHLGDMYHIGRIVADAHTMGWSAE